MRFLVAGQQLSLRQRADKPRFHNDPPKEPTEKQTYCETYGRHPVAATERGNVAPPFRL